MNAVARFRKQVVEYKDRRLDRHSFAAVPGLDEAIRRDIVELKSLPSELKPQTVLFDPALPGDFPFLGMVDRRPCQGDCPRFGFSSGVGVRVKGRQGSAQTDNAWIAAVGSVDQYDYQPTIPRSDLMDMGAMLLDRELDEFSAGYLEQLNADCLDAVQAAGVAKAGIVNVYTEVAIIEAATADTLTDTDLNTLIAELPRKYRRNAVFVGSPAMTVRLKGLKDAVTGVSLWAPSLAVDTPPTLKGRPYIEDEAMADDTLLFCNGYRAVGVAEREGPNLTSVEASGGDVKPFFAARAAVKVKDCRAAKLLVIPPAD